MRDWKERQRETERQMIRREKRCDWKERKERRRQRETDRDRQRETDTERGYKEKEKA